MGQLLNGSSESCVSCLMGQRILGQLLHGSSGLRINRLMGQEGCKSTV